jgi:DNA-binding response OmpR family regulator
MNRAATLLIIDDDLATTETFARMLRLHGYRVRTAQSAQGGLVDAHTAPPDAIILDLHMPIVDGLGFLCRLRAHEEHRHTPVAIVTGDYFLDDNQEQKLKQLGAELHFKPLWLDDLVRLAHSLLTPDRQVQSLSPSAIN